MSDEAKSDKAPEQAAAAQVAPPEPRHRPLWQVIRDADPLALGALVTAIAASVIAIIQTAFMWTARNDEVEAALRAEQLRACVGYRMSAEETLGMARTFADDPNYLKTSHLEEDPEHGFQILTITYSERVAHLQYLLPVAASETLTTANDASLDAFMAYANEDAEQLGVLSAEGGAWTSAHNQVLERCDAVIREVRDS